WLEEYGDSDADRARAEFLRVACRMKAKVRITKDEQKWLAEHLRRRLASRTARRGEGGAQAVDPQGSRRRPGIRAVAPRHTPPRRTQAGLEMWRGFVWHATDGSGFEELAAAVVADEPLARHGIGQVLSNPWRLADGRHRFGLLPSVCCGRAVWDRVSGYASIR